MTSMSATDLTFGTKATMGASAVALILTLLTVGMQIGSLTTEVEVHGTELKRVHATIETLRLDVQSLELYIRELQIEWGRNATTPGD